MIYMHVYGIKLTQNRLIKRKKRNKFYLILLMFVSYLTKEINGTEPQYVFIKYCVGVCLSISENIKTKVHVIRLS